jgi:hypothetical protein
VGEELETCEQDEPGGLRNPEIVSLEDSAATLQQTACVFGGKNSREK